MGRKEIALGLVTAWLGLGLLLTPVVGQAAITSTSAAPPVFTVASHQPTLVSRTVTWQVSGNLPVLAPGDMLLAVLSNEISSPSGTFVTDTGSVQTLGTAPPLPAEPGPTASLAETVSLSAEMIRRAQRLRAQRILLVRTFEQRVTIRGRIGGVVTTARFVDTRTETVAFYLATALGGPLRVFRVALRFDDGAVQRLVEPEADLDVWADIDFTGSGRLRAVWEIAESASSAGAPLFRPLPGSDVDRLLGPGQRLSVPGPRLPTWQAGLHLVRLRVLEPGSAFGDPEIRYHVLGSAAGERGARPGGIEVSSPASEAELEESTEFVWKGVPGTVVYRLEFFRAPAANRDPPLFTARGERFRDVRGSGGRVLPYELREEKEPVLGEAPLAGVLLPRNETRTGLPVLTRTRLLPGQSYLWRVRAIGPAGDVVATSRVRTLRIPVPPASGS